MFVLRKKVNIFKKSTSVWRKTRNKLIRQVSREEKRGRYEAVGSLVIAPTISSIARDCDGAVGEGEEKLAWVVGLH